jgi:uncharacterized protein with von Willebrand factor type A (vWA) domain
MKFGGEPIVPSFRQPALKRRRVVALCDVSGSMQNDTRALLAFFHAGVAAGGPFEAFSLGTRTVRLTRALARPGAAAAVSAAAALARGSVRRYASFSTAGANAGSPAARSWRSYRTAGSGATSSYWRRK